MPTTTSSSDQVAGMGVGTELASCLVEPACASAFTLLTAPDAVGEPTSARVRRLGFRARASHRAEFELELGLKPNDCRLGTRTTHSEVIA